MNIFKRHFTVNQSILIIIATVLGSSFLLYIPFHFDLLPYLGFKEAQTSLLTVYQNFDGPLYIVPAKTFYVPSAIESLRLEQSLPLEYYAAHLPLYPIFIRLFASIFSYLQSMLVVNLLFTCLFAIAFYFIVRKFKITEHPLILTVVLLFLPRLLVVRSVGSPETLFMFFILLSVYFFEQKNFLLAGLFGGISIWAKSPGVLLAPAFGLVLLEILVREKKFRFEWLWLFLIPGGFLVLCVFYYFQYGDFFAYFNSGDNHHIVAPFSVFNFQRRWVGTAWLEEIVLYMIIYLYSIISLKDTPYRSFFYFPLVFFCASILVDHRDLSRYMLPIWPFAAIALQQTLTSKKFLLTLLILLPAIYLYALNFMQYNILPVSDWRPFL